VVNLIASLFATAAHWVQNQTSLKNTKWVTQPKEWPTHSSPPKKYKKLIFTGLGDLSHLAPKEITHSEMFMLGKQNFLIAFCSLMALI
jgi:hypothetical protein